ncbi:helix-turn-helix transcriptional regulator [Halococcus saccharolyticus]|uniref:Uncharacterized protein n=1 Tax=Halococcus saccharolyticus DSM 5350 TaxID=1227455 RepID=M0MEV2_9EURY|nr:hypothetical protein [Halococcus saccharolyticus]EMA44251.1 hypothetical protein C449_12013 [Halococcus saccharolyticus DSM 5350]
MSDIIERRVVEEWGDDQGRTEVQVSRNSNRDRYEVRLACYQENGRFANFAPHVAADEKTMQCVREAFEELAPVAREANEREKLADISELVDELGHERAMEVLSSTRDLEANIDRHDDAEDLGDTQVKVMEAIAEGVNDSKEMGDALEITEETARKHLRELWEAGYLTRVDDEMPYTYAVADPDEGSEAVVTDGGESKVK